MKINEKKDLRRFVKEQIRLMRSENTTGNVGSYDTPNAFSKNKDADEPSSFDVEDDQYAYSIKAPKETKNMVKLSELSYKNFKVDESRSSVQKVNSNILEVAKRLNEVSRMLNHSIKLKTEQKMTDNVHWKKTNEALVKMHKKLQELAEKANGLYNLSEATATTIKTTLVDLFTKAGMPIKLQDVDYNQVGTDHYEFDVMLMGEPQAIDYLKGELMYQGYNEEVLIGNIDQEDEVVKKLTQIFKS